MKKIIQLLLIAFLLSFGVKGQVFTPIHNYQQPDGLSVLKYFGIPYGDTPTFNGVTRRIPGALFYSTSDSSMYGYTGSQWLKIGGNGISTINIIDSSHISVCNLSGCDTFSTTVNAQLVHVLSDTSFAICDTLANCDTFYINQTQFSSTLFDTTTIYNLLYQRLPISDTADENGNPRWMPYGIVQDTTARINDSVTVQTYTDGTSVYDTSRFAFTQENITAIQNINNYLDSLQGPDTTFIRGPTANGSDVLYATQDPNSDNDTLHLDFPHNSVGLDSLAQFDADGNVKQVAISDISSGGITGVDNVGAGNRLVTTDGTEIKTLFPGIDILIDSSTNTNGLTIHADTTDNNLHLATQGDITNAINAIPPSGGGGSGVPALIPKPILFGRSDSTIQQDTTIVVDSLNTDHSRTLKVGTIIPANWTGDTIVTHGNSVMQGGGVTGDFLLANGSYSFGMANIMIQQNVGWGLGLNDIAISGATVTGAGGYSSIHTKRPTEVAIILHYGINEALDTATWTHAAYVTGFKRLLDTVIAKGWAAKDIYITTIAGTSLGLSGTTNAKMREFNSIMDSLHTVYGTQFIDLFERIQQSEFSYITKGLLHPGKEGYEAMGYMLAGAIKGNFNMVDHKLAVNGTSQLSNLIFKNLNYVTRGQGLLALDSSGKAGVSHTLPSNTSTQGDFILNGLVYQRGATFPTNGTTRAYDSTRDLLLTGGVRIWSASGSTQRYAYVNLNNGGNTNIVNNAIVGDIRLYSSNGSDGGDSILAMRALPNGNIDANVGIMGVTSGLSLRYGTATSVTTGAWMNNTAGRMTIQNGGTFTDIPMARMVVNSTTEGVLVPRMTTTQRDLVSGVTGYTITSAGSGQTNGGWLVTFTATTGTGATAVATVSGGAITSVTISNPGNGYSGTVTGTIAAGGTPGTLSFSYGPQQGNMLYDSTKKTLEVSTGWNWHQAGAASVLKDFYTDSSNTGTSETDLYRYYIPMSTFIRDGEKVNFTYTLNLSDVSATAQIRVNFAGTDIANTGALTVNTTGTVNVEGWIIRTGSTTARSSVTISSPTTSTALYTSQNDLTGLTFSGVTNLLKLTGQSEGAGGGSGDITAKLGTITFMATAN